MGPIAWRVAEVKWLTYISVSRRPWHVIALQRILLQSEEKHQCDPQHYAFWCYFYHISISCLVCLVWQESVISISCQVYEYIVACQRGRVSQEPPWLRDETQGVTLLTAACAQSGLQPSWTPDCAHADKLLKCEKIRANMRPVLLRKGEPGTPQYSYCSLYECTSLCTDPDIGSLAVL